MFRKQYFTFLLAISFVLAAGLTTLAQMGAPVRGRVEMTKNGAKVPVPDATIDAFRNEGKGKITAKTNKKGEFSYAGLMLGQTYTLAVSAPGIRPQVYPKVKSGMEAIIIEVTEGDGTVLTEEEAKKLANQALPADGEQLTEAQKKEIADLEKKNAEIQAKNDRIKSGDETVRKMNSEGQAALTAKNWDLALAKYNEGIQAVPDFVGSTPVLMNGKIVALRNRGYNLYIEGAQSKEAPVRLAKYADAKKEFDEAIKTYEAAKAILKAAGPGTEPNDQKYRTNITHELLTNIIEVYRLAAVGQVDTSRADEAGPLFEEFIAAEADPVKKLKARQNLGDIYRLTGNFEKAIVAYKLVLEAAPDNQEVMALIGLSLFGLGTSVEPYNKEQLQEGLNYLDKYAQTAQVLSTDSQQQKDFKQSVKDTAEYLKTEQNLKAQKVPATKPGRKN